MFGALQLGLGLTRGQGDGRSTVLTRALLGDIWNGLAIEFRENSYAMRASTEAEILLNGEVGLSIAFPQNEYAMRD